MAHRDLHIYHVYMRYLRLVHGAYVLFRDLFPQIRCPTVAYDRRRLRRCLLPRQSRSHVSKHVAILGVSLFVLGLGLAPLVAGPMSEIYGRNIIYRVSFALFFLCMFPVAFAPNICMCFCCVLSLVSRPHELHPSVLL
jgi:MFS family permease